MADRIAGLSKLSAVLLLLSGCAVAIEPDEASERPDPSSGSAPAASSNSDAGVGGAAGTGGTGGAGAGATGEAGAGGAGEAGAGGAGEAGASGAGGSGVSEADAGAAGAAPDSASLCPTTTEYAVKYFDALKAGAQLAPCTASSCAQDECCWKQKACVEL